MIRLIEGQRLEKRLSNHDQKLEIQLKGWKLDQAKSAKLLGLKLDKQLSFDVYIDCFCKKLPKRSGILNRIKA